MALTKEFNTESLILGAADQFAFVAVDVKVLRSIDDGKVFCALDYHVNRVFHVENERRCPVHRSEAVNIALSGCANDHVAELHAHVHDTLSKV